MPRIYNMSDKDYPNGSVYVTCAIARVMLLWPHEKIELELQDKNLVCDPDDIDQPEIHKLLRIANPHAAPAPDESDLDRNDDLLCRSTFRYQKTPWTFPHARMKRRADRGVACKIV